jgi:hypothetical protein
MIGPSQRPQSDNIQESKEAELHDPAGCEPAIPTRQRSQFHALDGEVTEIGS